MPVIGTSVYRVVDDDVLVLDSDQDDDDDEGQP